MRWTATGLCTVLFVTGVERNLGGGWLSDSGIRPQLRSGAEAADAYRVVQHRVAALLRGRTSLADLHVPACPGWTIHNVLCHLVGTAQDIVSDRLQGAGSEAWTAAQVDRLAGRPIDDLLDTWAALAAQVAGGLHDGPKLYGSQIVFDTLTHEHDLRGAVAEPGSRGNDLASTVALSYLVTMVDRAIRRSALPALRLTTETVGTVQLGDPIKAPSRVALSLTGFEVLRSFGGRRSVEQLLALPWDGRAAALLPVFTSRVVRPPADPLIE